jgi:putative membrane protein
MVRTRDRAGILAHMSDVARYFPHLLLALYAVEFAVLGVAPYDRAVWYIENGPIVAVVAVLVVLWVRGVRFSNLAYALTSVLVFLHTVGGHYTFERVPFEWFGRLFGFERNMFDRVAHFSVGLYAFAMAEWLERSRAVTRRFLVFVVPIAAIGFVAAFYEIVEWLYAAYAGNPEAGAAFLGSQGDVWDAQKDMALDVLGAIAAVVLYAALRRRPVTSPAPAAR